MFAEMFYFSCVFKEPSENCVREVFIAFCYDTWECIGCSCSRNKLRSFKGSGRNVGSTIMNKTPISCVNNA
jgi:hypothetical protein